MEWVEGPALTRAGAIGRLHSRILAFPQQAAFVERFGPYAGWAHNTLFIAELASTRDKVPAIGASSKGRGSGGGKRKAVSSSSSESAVTDSRDEGSAGSSYSAELTGVDMAAIPLPLTPAEGEAAAGRRHRRRSARKTAAAAMMD